MLTLKSKQFSKKMLTMFCVLVGLIASNSGYANLNTSTSASISTSSYTQKIQQAIQADALNLDQVKQQLKQYVAQGTYAKQQQTVIQTAKLAIEQMLLQVEQAKQSNQSKQSNQLNPSTTTSLRTTQLAVVLDIDETALSNYEGMQANEFAYIKAGGCHLPQGTCDWESWKRSLRAPAIAPTLMLFNWLKTKKVAVFFITGRNQDDFAVTQANLKKAGYADWQGLFLRKSQAFPTVVDYKTAMRKEITAKGYTVIANIGDQNSDLIGGYAQMQFKMPNPFYIIE